MGLFDGTGPDGEAGSTAALARLTSWPVVLVVDARHQGASAAALVAGFARHDPELPLAGIIFNRVAGPRHRACSTPRWRVICPIFPASAPCRDARIWCCPNAISAWFRPASKRRPKRSSHVSRGWLPRASISIGWSRSRALQRLPAPRRPSRCCRSGHGSPSRATTPSASPTPRCWRAGAGRAPSCRSSRRSPTRRPTRRRMRSTCRAGTPNSMPAGSPRPSALLPGCTRAAASGAAIYGECGGYMVLGEALVDAEGRSPPDGGPAPALDQLRRAAAASRLSRRDAARRRPARAAGEHFRGHEFHYATTIAAGAAVAAPLRDWPMPRAAISAPSGLRQGSVMGSFIHLIDRARD